LFRELEIEYNHKIF